MRILPANTSNDIESCNLGCTSVSSIVPLLWDCIYIFELISHHTFITAGDTKFDSNRGLAYELCVGLAYGIIVGVGLIIFWVYRAHVRAQQRQEKVCTTIFFL